MESNSRYKHQDEANNNCGGFEWPSESQTKLMCTACTRRWLLRSQYPWWDYLWCRALRRLGHTPAAETYLREEKEKLGEKLTELLKQTLGGPFPWKLYQILSVWLEQHVVSTEEEFRKMEMAADVFLTFAWSRPTSGPRL